MFRVRQRPLSVASKALQISRNAFPIVFDFDVVTNTHPVTWPRRFLVCVGIYWGKCLLLDGVGIAGIESQTERLTVSMASFVSFSNRIVLPRVPELAIRVIYVIN